MSSYYSSIIILSWLSLGILCVLVHENDRISRKDKRLFYLTYLIIGVSALAEWAGLMISGNESVPHWVLKLVKCADYILTPAAGGTLVGQMKLKNRWNKILLGVLAVNALFQMISAFTGWMIIIDSHNQYVHGPLYFIYIIFYIIVIVLIIVQFLLYGKSFRKQNRLSLYAIIGFLLVGAGMQEVIGGSVRTAYISLTITAAMMFIHYTEFSQQRVDEQVLEQQITISTDALTGMLSRHAYSQALRDYSASGALPQDLVAFAVDINDLKAVNDKQGHEAGDELIRNAASCLSNVFQENSRIFRTGGDEFVILSHMPKVQADETIRLLKEETDRHPAEINLAAGYAAASDFPGISCEKLIKEADREMYRAKDAWYIATGRDRRHR